MPSSEQELADGFVTWVIDNASTDSTAAVVRAHPVGARLIAAGSNLGFAGAAEIAVREATTPFVVVLNQDARPEPGWLAALLAPLTAPDAHRIAAVTSKVIFTADGRLNNTGVIVGRDGYGRDRGFGQPDDGRFAEPEDVFAFSGTAAALRVVAARDVGSFDPSFFLYYEDTDLSWRLQLGGWRVRYAPDAVVRHVHGASTDVSSKAFAFYNERNRLLMLAKCAPRSLAVKEVVRFAGITLMLPIRRLTARRHPEGPSVPHGDTRARACVVRADAAGRAREEARRRANLPKDTRRSSPRTFVTRSGSDSSDIQVSPSKPGRAPHTFMFCGARKLPL